MGRATSMARQSHLFRDPIMLTIRQSPFDLFERLEQQLATAERVPNAEILDNKDTYIVRLELPGVDRDSIDIKARKNNNKNPATEKKKRKKKKRPKKKKKKKKKKS